MQKQTTSYTAVAMLPGDQVTGNTINLLEILICCVAHAATTDGCMPYKKLYLASWDKSFFSSLP